MNLHPARWTDLRGVALSATAFALTAPLSAQTDGVAYLLDDLALSRFDLKDGSRTDIRGGGTTFGEARDLKVSADGSTVYVVDGMSLSAVDVATGAISTLAALPGAVALDLEPAPGGQLESYVHVVTYDRGTGAGTLHEFDLGGAGVSTVFSLPAGGTSGAGYGYALLPRGDEALLAVGSTDATGTLYRLDIASGAPTVLPSSSFFWDPFSGLAGLNHIPLVATAAGDRAFFASGGEVHSFDLASDQLASVLVAQAFGLALSGDESRLFVLEQERHGYAFDLSTNGIDRSTLYSFRAAPQHGLDIDDGGTLYTAGRGSATSWDPAAGIETSIAHPRAGDIAVDPAAGAAYLVCAFCGTLTSVDLDTGAITGVVSVPGIEAVALQSDGSLIASVHDPAAGTTEIARVDAASGQQGVLVSVPRAGISDGIMLDRSEQTVYLELPSSVVEVPLDGSQPTTISLDPTFLQDAALTTGGEIVATTTAPGSAQEFSVLDLSDGSVRSRPFRNSPAVQAFDITPEGSFAIAAKPNLLEQIDLADGNAVPVSTELVGLAHELVYFNTADGSGVTTSPVDPRTGKSLATVTYQNVLAPGETTAISSTSGSSPPTGFQIGSGQLYLDISTTAEFGGTVDVCVDYSDASYTDETRIRLFHHENGAWKDVTTSLDPSQKRVCGTVTSLSPFTVFELQPGLDAVGLLQLLVSDTADVNVRHGIDNSLDTKLDRAMAALTDANTNNNGSAINALNSYINEVDAQSGIAFPAVEGEALRNTASIIIDLLGG